MGMWRCGSVGSHVGMPLAADGRKRWNARQSKGRFNRGERCKVGWGGCMASFQEGCWLLTMPVLPSHVLGGVDPRVRLSSQA